MQEIAFTPVAEMRGWQGVEVNQFYQIQDWQEGKSEHNKPSKLEFCFTPILDCGLPSKPVYQINQISDSGLSFP